MIYWLILRIKVIISILINKFISIKTSDKAKTIYGDLDSEMDNFDTYLLEDKSKYYNIRPILFEFFSKSDYKVK